MASTRGRQVSQPLTNKSGGSVAKGDVVIIDTSNDEAFTTTTSARSEVSIGVVLDATIANNAAGRVITDGYAPLINVPASVTRGHYMETHTVAKQATGSSSRRSGSFGQFFTGGTTPSGWIWGKTDQTVTTAPTFSGVHCTHNANQSISNITETSVALNTERYDTDAFHDTASNNSRLTVPSGKAGKYYIHGQCEFTSNGTGARILYIKLNGTTYIAQVQGPGNQGGLMEVSTVYDLSVADYVEFRIFHNAGTSLNVLSSSNYSPGFMMHLLG